MKKEYISPEAKGFKVESLAILADSITNTSGVSGLGVGGDTGDYNITEGASRQGGFWDDEE